MVCVFCSSSCLLFTYLSQEKFPILESKPIWRRIWICFTYNFTRRFQIFLTSSEYMNFDMYILKSRLSNATWFHVILVLLNHFLWCLICNSLWLKIPFTLSKEMHFICLLRLIPSKITAHTGEFSMIIFCTTYFAI